MPSGTGDEKSLGGGVPALLWAERAERPCVTPLPWETQGMLGMAMGTHNWLPWLFRPVVPGLPPLPPPRPTPAQAVEYRPKRRKLYASVVDGNQDAERSVAVGKWMELVELAIQESAVGRQIVEAQACGKDDFHVTHILESLVAAKATGTLSTRAGALFQYIAWFQRTAPTGSRPFPIRESAAFDYLVEMKRTRAPPTRAASFMQAWSFVVGVMGFDDPDETAHSLRCVGSAHAQYVMKAPTAQAQTLDINYVILLELATSHIKDIKARLLAGYACVCLYGRLRCSDAGRIRTINDLTFFEDDYTESGMLECQALATKTAKSKEKKSTFLPIVIPVKGISGASWWRNFLKDRKAFGLRPMPSEPGDYVPLLASFSGSDRVIESGELTVFLQKFSQAFNVKHPFTSHSLKATFLAACAKDGMDIMSRQLLGYHVARGEYSALNYGRDNIAGPMEKFQELLGRIREGRFLPDALRGERRPGQDPTPAMVAFESFMSLAEAKRRLEGIELNVAGWETWGISPSEDGTGSSGSGGVPGPGSVGSGGVPEPESSGSGGVPGAVPVGGVPDWDCGGVPAKSSPVGVPGAGSDSGSSDDDPEQPPLLKRKEPDDATVTEAVLAKAAGTSAKFSEDKMMVRHKSRLTVHRVSVDPARIAGGRWVNSNFELVPFTTEAWPKCVNTNCFG